MTTEIPITLKDAWKFVNTHHRTHSTKAAGGLFAIAATQNTYIGGVVIVGRPSSRVLDNGWTAEVTRCCTIGQKNMCSFLYGKAWQATKAMGYKKLITYVLDDEPGTSLKACGWKKVWLTKGRKWSSDKTVRRNPHAIQDKYRWEIVDESKRGAVYTLQRPRYIKKSNQLTLFGG